MPCCGGSLGGKALLDYIPLTPLAGRAATTAELRELAAERMHGLGYARVATEFSPAGSGLRFDVIGIASRTRQVRIYEVKSSRGDFLSDGKWQRYLDYCTHFAFVAPAGAIQRWELDRAIGLVEYGSPSLRNLQRARRYGARILREDALRAARPSQRLRDHVADGPWTALLESLAFANVRPPEPVEFARGGGI